MIDEDPKMAEHRANLKRLAEESGRPWKVNINHVTSSCTVADCRVCLVDDGTKVRDVKHDAPVQLVDSVGERVSFPSPLPPLIIFGVICFLIGTVVGMAIR